MLAPLEVSHESVSAKAAPGKIIENRDSKHAVLISRGISDPLI
jgi:hypothetical protein